MRQSLADSIAAIGTADGYVKGSIVLCVNCYKPIYRLERGIAVGERVKPDAYRPLTAAQLGELADRAERGDVMISPILRGLWKAWTPQERAQLAETIATTQSGMLAQCPFCQLNWVRARIAHGADGELHDRAFVWELMTIPPEAPIPGKVAAAWRDAS